jgi:glycerol uptake facilitator-like aquaporin
MLSKDRVSAVVAELLGTFLLSLAVLSVDRSTLNLPFFISVTAGLAVASMILIFGRISGAQLNPAITLGLLTINRIRAVKALAYIAAQLIGGALAYYLFTYFYGANWHSLGHYSTKLLVAETVGTFLFSMGWSAVVFRKLDSARSAVIAGLSFTLALIAVSAAGTVTLNPAVALSLRTWVWGSSVLGPLLGAVIGFQVYHYLFVAREVSEKLTKDKIPATKNTTMAPQRVKSLR